jgi:membrane protease YdiL (CAAX protease family)
LRQARTGFEKRAAAGSAIKAAMNTTSIAPAAADAEPRLSRRATSLLVIATFLVVNATGLTAFHAVAADLDGWPRMLALALFGYGHYLIGPLAVAAVLRGRRNMFMALGLAASPWPALVLATGCSAIVLAWIAATSTPVPLARLPLDLMRTAVVPGIAEEILFRAFLFGFLYRFAGWGFLPAALLSALVFGLEHVYQGGDAMEALGIAMLTGLGGLWWSWLLVEWRWNLWVPIAFHVLLNAYWTAFDVADNALGEVASVGVRLVCIALSIAVTVALARRRGGLQVQGRQWIAGG